MNNDPLNPIDLLIALIALLTTREIAVMIGPYAAICVLAFAGAGVALSGNDKEMSNLAAAKYIALRLLLAVSLTVGLAEAIQYYAPGLKPRITLMPVAFMVGWVRDYNVVASWVGDQLSKLIPTMFKAKKPDE